jgi:thiamine biosynthesis lipoprotein ApbE
MNRFAGVVCFLMSWTLPHFSEAATLETPMVSISGEAQGTTYHIKYFDGQNRNFKVQIDSILTEFDKSLSNYRKDSEIAEFNKVQLTDIPAALFLSCFKKIGRNI